jgi:hypothetical protein
MIGERMGSLWRQAIKCQNYYQILVFQTTKQSVTSDNVFESGFSTIALPKVRLFMNSQAAEKLKSSKEHPMRLVFLVAAIFAVACPAAAQPVFPQPSRTPAPTTSTEPGTLITAMTPQQVADLLNNASFPSKVVADDKNSNNKWVVTSFWGDNLYSGVLFNGNCDNSGACTILGFFANFGKSPNVNQDWVNGWNLDRCCVRAYFLSDQSLVFQYDVALFTGVSPDYVKAAAQFFKSAVDASTNFKP